MNTTELFNSFCLKDKITQVHADEIMQSLEEFETQIRLETIKEVLPEEADKFLFPRFNQCRQEIINKAKEKWNIEL